MAATRERPRLSRPGDGAYTIHEPWLLRGGFSDVVRLSPVGWRFPWRDGFTDGLTVFADGKIRPELRAPYFPRPFDAPLAVVPAFNWHLLPGGVSNVFWHASTPSNSLVVTWENSPVNRDANCLTNFQAEFFADGRFAYRYDDREVGYAPAFPFDWDNDGLENSVDPDPLVAGADAHGTNAEWYNTVCANIVNSNAYYFVDVVSERGPAPIYFTGDRASRLGNPVVVALAGVTNLVPLLMGITYSVTSTVPLAVSLPYDGFASVTTNGFSNYTVQWPLEFGFAVVPGGGYEVEVQPFDPGGEFSWRSASQDGALRGAPHRAFDCSYASVGNWIGFTCGTGGNCGCNGCSVDGAYSLEGASFTLPSVWCGCSAVGSGGGTNAPPSEPSVSVSFDKSVVFYEDAYTNAPNDVVAKRSTRTTLSVSVYGGEAGGTLHVAAQNIGKLVRTGGNTVPFPYRAVVPPYSSVSLSVEYEAAEHSESTDDISVAASVISLDGSLSAMSFDTVTVAKILLEAKVDFPSGFRRRHVYGVAELVECTVQPSIPNVAWVFSDTNQQTTTSACWEYELPSSPMTVTLNVGYRGVTLPIAVTCIAPTGYFVPRDPDVVIAPNVQVGDSGGFGMCIDLGIMPTNVCFSRIQVVEGGSSNDVHTGYYVDKTNDWHHGTAEGAWKEWVSVSTSNYAEQDMVTSATNTPPWQSGVLCWRIPNYWRTVSDPATNYFCTTPQTFRMFANGTQSISKFDWIAIRPTNTVSQIQYGKIRR